MSVNQEGTNMYIWNNAVLLKANYMSFQFHNPGQFYTFYTCFIQIYIVLYILERAIPCQLKHLKLLSFKYALGFFLIETMRLVVIKDVIWNETHWWNNSI